MSSKKKETATLKKSTPVKEEKDDNLQLSKDTNQNKVSNWLLVIGVASVVALGTAATVYYYRRRKQKLAYMQEDSWTIDTYKSTFNKYWNLTKKTFTAVSLSVNDFFAKNKENSPIVDADLTEAGGPFMVIHDEEHEEVLCEL